MDAPEPPGLYSQSHAAALQPIKEALFHSRLDHAGPPAAHAAALKRISDAEKAVADIDTLLRKCGCK